MDNVREHERELVAYALEVLAREVPGIELYGPPRRPARRRGAVQPAGHPPARRGAGPGPVRRSRSAPATTARCRSTSGSTSRPPPAPRSRSTRRKRTSTRWSPASRRSSALFGEADELGTDADASPTRLASLCRHAERGRHFLCTLTQMDDLYRDYILEHYRRPHNFGVIEEPSATYEGANPLCGDRITMQLGVRDGVVRAGRVHRPRLRDQPGHGLAADRRGQGQAASTPSRASAPTTCSTCWASRSARRASSARCSASTPSSTCSPTSAPSRWPRRRRRDAPLRVSPAGLSRLARPRASRRRTA